MQVSPKRAQVWSELLAKGSNVGTDASVTAASSNTKMFTLRSSVGHSKPGDLVTRSRACGNVIAKERFARLLLRGSSTGERRAFSRYDP